MPSTTVQSLSACGGYDGARDSAQAFSNKSRPCWPPGQPIENCTIETTTNSRTTANKIGVKSNPPASGLRRSIGRISIERLAGGFGLSPAGDGARLASR
jgi:hypothetical protein